MAKIIDIIITKNGFSNSIGCKRTIEPMSIHLLDPLTSTPMNGTNTNNTKNIKNNTIDNLNSFSCSKIEKLNKKQSPAKTNIKCLTKK